MIFIFMHLILVVMPLAAMSPSAGTNPSAKQPDVVKLDEHIAPVCLLAFSPDGKTLASVSNDNGVKLVRLWDRTSWTRTAGLAGHTSYIFGIGFSPDDKMLGSASADKTIILWEFKTQRKIATLKSPDQHYYKSLAFSADGKRLAVADGGWNAESVHFWDLANNKLIVTRAGHTFGVITIVSSRDGTLFAVGCTNGQIRIWEAATGKERITMGKPGKSHRESKSIIALAFLPGDKELLALSDDAVLRKWDVKTGEAKEILLKNPECCEASFSPDSGTVAVGDMKGNVRLWDCATGELLDTFKEHTRSDMNDKRYQYLKVFGGGTPDTPAICSLAFSPDGKLLASGSVDQLIYVRKLPEKKGK